MSADAELNSVLIRRQEMNDALDNGQEIKIKYRVVNIFTEFHEFTRKEIKQYETTFKKSTYSQELKKVKDTKYSGAGTDTVYIPTVTWFSLLDASINTDTK